VLFVDPMLLNLVVEIVMDGVVVNEWDLSSSDCKIDAAFSALQLNAGRRLRDKRRRARSRR